LLPARNRKESEVPTDVTQPEPCQQLIEQAITAFGQIDVLVNNISMLTRLGDYRPLHF